MKNFTKLFRVLTPLAIIVGLALAAGCSDDDEVVIFDAPTIAVVVDNGSPFQGDEITFSITVSSEAGLQSVSLDGMEIKSYSSETFEDQFTHAVTIESGATTGPTSFSFSVSDIQTEVLSDDFDVSVTIQNSDLRGTPFLVTDFQSNTPNAVVDGFEWSGFQDSWGFVDSWSIEHPAEDPTNSANVVVKGLRRFECCFDGFNTAFVRLTDPLPEEEVAAIISGERVFQMNIYYEETTREELAHNDPSDAGNPDNQSTVDFSFTLNEYGSGGWNFAAQDSVDVAIPVQVELGNRNTWALFPEGRGLQLLGTITRANEWETVTFSVGYNTTGDPESFSLAPKLNDDANTGFILDPDNVNTSNIDYIGMVFNVGFQGVPNPGGWFEIPGNGNGFSSDRVVNINDQHNPYYIDNIRIIDADAFDQNPNN